MMLLAQYGFVQATLLFKRTSFQIHLLAVNLHYIAFLKSSQKAWNHRYVQEITCLFSIIRLSQIAFFRESWIILVQDLSHLTFLQKLRMKITQDFILNSKIVSMWDKIQPIDYPDLNLQFVLG